MKQCCKGHIQQKFYVCLLKMSFWLKHHNFPPALTLRVYPLKKDDFVYIEKQPNYNENGVAMSLDGISVSTEKIYTLKF